MSDSIDIINAFALLTNFVILPALSYGSQLALGALAVTLVYSILRFSNFAQGDSMAFGTMLVIIISGYMISKGWTCLLYTSPSPRDRQKSRMPSSA